MEKVVYVLWRPAGDSIEAFVDRIRGDVARSLLDLGVRGLQVNVADDAVSAATVRLVELDPQMEGVVSIWVESIMDSVRGPIEDVLTDAASRVAGYLVTESTPLRNTTRAAALGERTDGFANLAFLRRPTRLTKEAWLDAWQNGHSQLAVDTQSTFGYTQNVVVRALTDDAPAFDGIVEELFPPEALTNLHAFFDAVGDDEKLTRNMTAMGESTERFGASESIDVVPTSQYVMSSPFRSNPDLARAAASGPDGAEKVRSICSAESARRTTARRTPHARLSRSPPAGRRSNTDTTPRLPRRLARTKSLTAARMDAREPALLPLCGPAELEGTQPPAGGFRQIDEHLVVRGGQARLVLELTGHPPSELALHEEQASPGSLFAAAQPSGTGHLSILRE